MDGTFRRMTKNWRHLFILLAQYKDSWQPVAYGWPPDKTSVSYHVFLLMLLMKLKEMGPEVSLLYGACNLRMKRMKLDYEDCNTHSYGTSVYIIRLLFSLFTSTYLFSNIRLLFLDPWLNHFTNL